MTKSNEDHPTKRRRLVGGIALILVALLGEQLARLVAEIIRKLAIAFATVAAMMLGVFVYQNTKSWTLTALAVIGYCICVAFLFIQWRRSMHKPPKFI